MATRSNSRQAGFTLIELLVVVAIISILSSIAISQYALYKEKAVDSKMESTLHAGRQAMESYYVENDTYASATVSDLSANHGFLASQNVTLTIAPAPPPTSTSYALCAYSIGGTAPAFFYSSAIGNIVPDTGTSCP